MATVGVVIMAHPKRQHFIPYLLEHLGDVPVIWDERNDRWDTGRRAMAAFDPDVDWHLVVQDDAILCKDFLAGAIAALEHVPPGPVSFYTGRYSPHREAIARAVYRARRARAHYLVMEGPHWGVAVAVPTALIPGMLAGCEQLKHVANYDMRMSRYFTAQGIKCRYTLPSLVNHRVGDENPSLVPGRGNSRGRTAHHWIGDQSALSIRWDKGQVFDVAVHPPTRRNGKMSKRIANRRIYGRDAKGRAVLIAAPGQPIPEGYALDEEAVQPSPVQREKVVASQNLGALKYPELQKLAKKRGIPANQKRDRLIQALS
jgi:hypothetical protein